MGATHAITTLEALLLASDELDELIELNARLLTLDLLLAVLDKVSELDEAFELESDERFAELFEPELTSDELETLVAAELNLLELEATEDRLDENRLDKENELTVEDIFDELLLIASLELKGDEELELNAVFTEETEFDTVLDTTLVAADEKLFELDPATTKDEIELLLFSATLTLELANELMTTDTELTLATELLPELGGVGAEEVLPAPPPQALSSKDTTTIFPTKKYNRKPSISLDLLHLDDMTVLVKY